jgi:hypothetical protein
MQPREGAVEHGGIDPGIAHIDPDGDPHHLLDPARTDG